MARCIFLREKGREGWREMERGGGEKWREGKEEREWELSE